MVMSRDRVFAVQPGDDGAAIRSAVVDARRWTAQGPDWTAVVELQPGTHLIDAPSDADYAIAFRDLRNVTLTGQGATLMFQHERIGGLLIERCSAVAVTHLTIDYAKPAFLQGEITAVTPDGFRVRPQDGYPDFRDRELFTDAGYGTLRTADGQLKPDVRQTFMITNVDREPGPDGSFHIELSADSARCIDDVSIGDGFVTGYRGEHHGVHITASSDTVIEHVTIHTAPCAAIVSSDADGTRLTGVTVTRRPGSTAWISTNADAFHCQGGRRGPVITDCTFEGMHDDGVNLYVHALRVVAVDGRTVDASGTGAIAAGDRIQFVDSTRGLVAGTSTVSSVVREDDRVTLHLVEDPPSTDTVDQLYNLSNANSGFLIENCLFRDFRGIGVRLKASDGWIIGCRFERLSGIALWIANDPAWGEGPIGSTAVSIRDCVVQDAPLDRELRTWPETSAAAIMIEAFDAADAAIDGVVHSDISLESIVVETAARAAVSIGAASDITVTDLVTSSDVRIARRD